MTFLRRPTVFVPLSYAIMPVIEQRAVAQRIVDLRMLRDPRLDREPFDDAGSDDEQRAQIVGEMAQELASLEAPFAAPHRHRIRRRRGSIDRNGSTYDEASFLRRFPGEPALAGDLLLAQVEARVAGELFQPLLGLTAVELRRTTDWWASLGTTEHAGFEGAIRRASAFYTMAATALESAARLGAEPPADTELARLATLCRARADLLQNVDATGRFFEYEPARLVTRIGPVSIPARLVQAAAGAILARPSRRPYDGPPPTASGTR